MFKEYSKPEEPMRLVISILIIFSLLSCFRSNNPGVEEDISQKINVVTTTGMINDIVLNLGGDKVSTQSLMGPGVDPHLYKASAWDVQTLLKADVILYNGLNLEGKMTEVFKNMSKRGISTIAVAEELEISKLQKPESLQGYYYDPHIWFDVELWIDAVNVVKDVLIKQDRQNSRIYITNAEIYNNKLKNLQGYIHERIRTLPKEKKVLITAHDAFGYFGAAYDFEVIGLQGISTDSEAGVADVQKLSKLIAERKIPAIFVESSVSPKYIEAVTKAVKARGFDVKIGGTLYSDALGNPETPEAEYIGMFKHNINTIVDALNYEGR